MIEKEPNCVLLESSRIDSENKRSFLFLHPTECGYHFEKIAEDVSIDPSLPLAWFGVYSALFIFDHELGKFENQSPETPPSRKSSFSLKNCLLGITEKEYVRAFSVIKDYIAAGGKYILSFSPELFFRAEARRLMTKPMKGTTRRGRNSGEDLVIVLFRNERDEMTEGAVSNIFVESEGKLYTPPLSSGLLPGIFRQHILQQTSGAAEKVLSLDELLQAGSVFICSAIRGMRRVQVIHE